MIRPSPTFISYPLSLGMKMTETVEKSLSHFHYYNFNNKQERHVNDCGIHSYTRTN
jgi:hypothetical protein